MKNELNIIKYDFIYNNNFNKKMSFSQKCQLLIVGDSTVGKTSILRRFAQEKFNADYLATIGVDFFTKDVIINEKKIHVKMWDTAGQERYKTLTAGFFRNAQGLIFVYDITQEDTFNNLKYWIESVHNNAINAKDLPGVILGNKIDITERVVDKKKGEDFSKSVNYKYFDVSAKTGEGVDESMKYLIQKVVSYLEKNTKEEKNNNINIEKDLKDKDKEKKDTNCCDKK